MASNCGWVNWCLLKRLRKRGSTARETCRAMRAKGRSPTSAIAPPASIENHATGPSPSRISMKLLGCQQSLISSKFLEKRGRTRRCFAARFALLTRHRSLEDLRWCDGVAFSDHKDARDQDPEDRREAANDDGAPSGSIVETSAVDGACVHGRNGTGAERGADIGQPSGPPGQRPSSPTRVTCRTKEESRR